MLNLNLSKRKVLTFFLLEDTLLESLSIEVQVIERIMSLSIFGGAYFASQIPEEPIQPFWPFISTKNISSQNLTLTDISAWHF